MSNTGEGGGDGGDDELWWTIVKVAIFVIGAIVVLRFVFNLIWALMPFIVIAGLAYLAYKIFLAPDSTNTEVETQEPMLLEHDTSDVIFDDEDPLEQKFRDLEAKQSRVDSDR